ncbi:putative glycosyltransferase, exosortase G system-associated [Weissella coleopterorum]|uniref:Putative glycosyltransferase, exosortase G system-associated n=1 Tax=Weissella coleopterorum TaxID=2714949 RepID=A0A6G8AZ40_9LACO|nr:TIGR03111 family XrtG-associated glycosyltransferase [Weissella coleopterorum]QIL50361.1 putative glycosyltransferase, exosortase G system-associated [Weissella coleopterorum]
MEGLLNSVASQYLFVGVWLLIPVLVEVIPTLFVYIKLLIEIIWEWILKVFSRTPSAEINTSFLPDIDVVIPVYNSEETLEACVLSVIKSTYPTNKIKITLVNNQSTDHSFKKFQEIQNKYNEAMISWLDAAQGKSKALNMAMYNTFNKYFIHVDSDGELEEHALLNMVRQFEREKGTVALTGIILTQKELIKRQKNPAIKLMDLLEYHEYSSAFLVGRNSESGSNSMFTMSGAFSGFRRSELSSTFMFSSETVGEDTHMTFQMRNKGEVRLAKDAIFFVEPLDSFDMFYRQRQRWQMGELQVIHMFEKNGDISIWKFFSNFMVRKLMLDHTFVFPRLIWFFSPAVLVAKKFSVKTLIIIYISLYLLYVFISGLFYLLAQIYLRKFKKEYHFFVRSGWVIGLMPLYKFVLSWVLLAALLNGTDQMRWRVRSLIDEISVTGQLLRNDGRRFKRFMQKIKDNLDN